VTTPDAAAGEEIVVLLERMPAWSDLPRAASAGAGRDPKGTGIDGAAGGRQEIESIAAQIAAHDLDDVARGVAQFVDRASKSSNFDVSTMSKLYVLHRNIFDVPMWTTLGGPRFGSFIGVPVEGARVG